MAVLKAHTAQSQVRAVAKHTHRSEARGGSCVCSPGGCVSGGRRSPVPVLISACGAWAAHPTRLRLLVGLCTMAEPYSAAFAARRRWLHCALNRRTDSRGVANGSRCCEWVESFGVANGSTSDLLSGHQPCPGCDKVIQSKSVQSRGPTEC